MKRGPSGARQSCFVQPFHQSALCKRMQKLWLFFKKYLNQVLQGCWQCWLENCCVRASQWIRRPLGGADQLYFRDVEWKEDNRWTRSEVAGSIYNIYKVDGRGLAHGCQTYNSTSDVPLDIKRIWLEHRRCWLMTKQGNVPWRKVIV